MKNKELIKTFTAFLLQPNTVIFYFGKTHLAIEYIDPERLDEIENAFLEELKDSDGYLNIGRQTADNTREIYFAYKDFKKPSKIPYQIEQRFSGALNIIYDIYKDKYWQSFNRFTNNK